MESSIIGMMGLPTNQNVTPTNGSDDAICDINISGVNHFKSQNAFKTRIFENLFK